MSNHPNIISSRTTSGLLTRRQVAARFGVHVETIKRWQNDGKLPAIALSDRVVRYELSAVERLIRESSTVAV